MTPRQYSAAALLALLAGSANSAMAQSTEPFPAQFQLSGLLPANGGNGTNGFVLNGIGTFDASGRSVSSAGDVNGDGIDDLIIGAYGADANGNNASGQSYVVFGGVGIGSGGVIELSSLNGTNGFVLNGIDNYDQSGMSVSSAGDVNGDGFDDLIIGAARADPNGVYYAGESYVVFGGPGVGGGGVLNLSSLNGSNGFVLNGIDESDLSGNSVSSAGDVNGDGIDDLIIGAARADPNGNSAAGESYVVFGGVGVGSGGLIELSSLNGPNGFVLNGVDNYDQSGISVSSAGDVNGDGVDDLLIGAYVADPNGNSAAGESYVVFGGVGVGSGGLIELSSLNGPNGFVLNGIDGSDFSGRSVSQAGDVNGDGVDDLIIGADRADPNGASTAGESYVVFGGVGVGSGGVIELSSLNGPNGFVLNGIDGSDFSGRSVSQAGDVNGDGIGDLIIGAYSSDPNGVSTAGESYVVFGGVGVGSGGLIELSSLNGPNGFVLNGIDTFDLSGSSVSSAGDVNGDGIDDLIIGAYRADPNGASYAGESYVVFGRANANVWTSPVGGSWDTGANWRSGVSPSMRLVTIDPTIGVQVTGPTGAVFLDRLTLGAILGRTTLDLDALSLVSVNEAFDLPASAAMSGSGIFVANDDFTNSGLIAMDGMSVLTSAGLTNTAGGTIAPIEGFVDGGLVNAGELDLSALDPAVSIARLELLGELKNESSGEIVLRRGTIELGVSDGIENSGDISVTYATADILGPIYNTASGSVSISGSSSLLVTDDITNASAIVLTNDSAMVVLGSIVGNGVSGPGGAGTAGSVFVEGGVIPGILGQPLMTSAFDGDLDLGPSAHTIIEIGGTTPGVTMDQLSSALNLGVGGTLEVQLVSGYVPQPGDIYPVLDFASASGTFSSIVLDPGLIAAGANTDALLLDGTITLLAPCPADTNGDGILDNGDIGTFVAFFLAGNLAADFNGDGILDNGDIGAFVAAFLAGC